MNEYCILGSQLASRVALFDSEYAFCFEEALNLLLLANNNEANKVYFQDLAEKVVFCYEHKSLGNSHFSKQENIESLLKLAGFNIDLELQLLAAKNSFVCQSGKNKISITATEKLLTDFHALPAEPDSPAYLEAKTTIYS